MRKLGFIVVLLIVIGLSSCGNTAIQCGEGTVPIDGVCQVQVTCDSGQTYDEETNTCEEKEVITCNPGYTNEDGECVLDEVELEIELVTGSQLSFEVGSTLPDFSTYFELEGTVIDNSMIEHTLLLGADNTMTTPGVFSVTITIGNDSKTISIIVTDSAIDYSDIITEGQAGIYLIPSKETDFIVGDYMPDFLSYFIAYDGENYVSITPDKVLHNLLLSADNRMIQAGTYKAWVDLTIGGTAYYQEVNIAVTPVGGATVESIGQTGWEIINPEFTDANWFDAWMVPSGDVAITNTDGEIDIQINTIGMNFWDILFAQPGKTFEKGYTYEVTYSMKTGLTAGRDVVVFVEPSQGAAKLLEEQVSLTTVYQDFTFTFQTTTNTTSGVVGVFLGANLPGAHPGVVMIDSIVITRTGELQEEVNFIDLPNQEFTSSDISLWATEGNVVLAHNASGYLEADVSAFTGAFYQENLQQGGYFIEAGKTYTIVFIIKTDITLGRDVTFFVEDTNAGYVKYFEETETLTTVFQTFTYTFTPTVDNDDTKIGIFLGDMDNSAIGLVIIDSIVITESN
ncbi:carbohydrate binding domain-containing protein [Mariniplasma anaerobium]|uniref:CBM-cenC domain-containing protein n=1 Tax=Mariniplasma anaerobium TaxID=2735436 RepID=A0A7U9TGN0_9MOLU|nr:carbohydrate binding domain-containing protein [Mariniplasma anaerobium]BCR35805.1 hypothetical protein MPAN_006980 [Mariniplasma anaerobium]